jgi:D-sedoheptulose 7-phosphate isomerase
VSQILDSLLQKNQHLDACKGEILAAYEVLKAGYRSGGKLLICGNGGSAADSEHIVGELMKSYRLRRDIPENVRFLLKGKFDQDGVHLAGKLQGALPAISLASHSSLITAISNDIGAEMIFAQQVYGLGKPNDVLLGISTSGNALNVRYAFQVARIMGLKNIGLTGLNVDQLRVICDVVVGVPKTDTYEIQESHIAVYHALCGMLEEEFFL